jgi:hypothetical protein
MDHCLSALALWYSPIFNLSGVKNTDTRLNGGTTLSNAAEILTVDIHSIQRPKRYKLPTFQRGILTRIICVLNLVRGQRESEARMQMFPGLSRWLVLFVALLLQRGLLGTQVPCFEERLAQSIFGTVEGIVHRFEESGEDRSYSIKMY